MAMRPMPGGSTRFSWTNLVFVLIAAIMVIWSGFSAAAHDYDRAIWQVLVAIVFTMFSWDDD